LQHSKTATAARHRQKRKEIEPQRCHSLPFRIDGFVDPIKVRQLGDVSLDAGKIVPNGFRRLVKLPLATSRDKDFGSLHDEEGFVHRSSRSAKAILYPLDELDRRTAIGPFARTSNVRAPSSGGIGSSHGAAIIVSCASERPCAHRVSIVGRSNS
jgi:hypothetical protein